MKNGKQNSKQYRGRIVTIRWLPQILPAETRAFLCYSPNWRDINRISTMESVEGKMK